MNKKAQALGLIAAMSMLLAAVDTCAAEDTGNNQDVFAGFYRLQQIDIANDPALMKIMHHIEKRKGPISVWQSKNSNLVYIVDLLEQSLIIIDINNQPSLEQPIPIKVGRGAISVVANNQDSVAFVTNLLDGTLSVIDVTERKVSGTLKLKVDSEPYCQIFGADESRLYVVTRRGDSVFVVDPVKRNVIDTLGVKDLSRDVQLKYCYQSCHEEKRLIMEHSIKRKPAFPDNLLTVSPDNLNVNGLRADQQRKFLNYYKDYLNKLESKEERDTRSNVVDSAPIEVEAGKSERISGELTLPEKMSLLDLRNRVFNKAAESSD
ncbi:MAG: hypothetical protein L0Z73_09540 [Gammaproteobacteria bacterium]|nr:hypothetical protein [Gammaproteobacteria bacterium]